MKGKKGTKLREWQKKYNSTDGECTKCKRNLPLTIDHIVPQSFLDQLGLLDEIYNDEENYELLCIYCNRYKGGRIDLLNQKTIPLLRKYIDKLI